MGQKFAQHICKVQTYSENRTYIVWIHLDSLWLWHVQHEFVMSPMPKVHGTHNLQQFELLGVSPRWLNIKLRLYYAHKGMSHVRGRLPAPRGHIHIEAPAISVGLT